MILIKDIAKVHWCCFLKDTRLRVVPLSFDVKENREKKSGSRLEKSFVRDAKENREKKMAARDPGNEDLAWPYFSRHVRRTERKSDYS